MYYKSYFYCSTDAIETQTEMPKRGLLVPGLVPEFGSSGSIVPELFGREKGQRGNK